MGIGKHYDGYRSFQYLTPGKDYKAFELRIYTAPEGKLDNLRARFRDHTMRVFERHGMTNIGYWTPRTHLTRWSTSSLTTAARPRRRAGRPWKRSRLAAGTP